MPGTKKHTRLLLEQLSRIDAHSPYWLLSAFLGDPEATRENALAVVDAGLRRTIIPDLACRLSQHAHELASLTGEAAAKERPLLEPAPPSGTQLSDYLDSLLSLETGLERFRRLETCSSRESRPQCAHDFTLLAEYAYEFPAPAENGKTNDMLAGEIAADGYRSELHLPPDARQRYADRIGRLMEDLRRRLDREVDAGTALLEPAKGSRDAVSDNAEQRDQWISWVSRSWLHSDASRNPCAAIRSALQEKIDKLTSQYGYPARLENSLDIFNADRCYRPLMERLGGMMLPSHGPLFIHDKDGSLRINPGLDGWTET